MAGKSGDDDFSMDTLADLLSEKGLEDADRLRKANAAREAQNISGMVSSFSGVLGAMGTLASEIDYRKEDIQESLDDVTGSFNPNHDKPFSGLVDELYGGLGEVRTIGADLQRYLEPGYTRLLAISEIYNDSIRNVMARESPRLRDAYLLQDGIQEITKMTVSALADGGTNFEKGVQKTFTAVYAHYRGLKKKYQGIGQDEKKMDPMERMFMQMMGIDPDKMKDQLSEKGPKIELIDDNAFLTETLVDIGDKLPRYYESIVPVGKRGKTKVLRRIDESEIERVGRNLKNLANPVYLEYLRNPNQFPETIARAIEDYFAHFYGLEPYLRGVVEAMSDSEHVVMRLNKRFKKGMPNPSGPVSYLRSLNYAAIRPSREESQPRTRVEKDFGQARRQLLTHLRDTLYNLEKVPEVESEEIATAAARKASKLKDDMDDISKTDKDKKLLKDIRKENEFYIGKTGQIGTFEAAREPAPTISYDDVFGSSFNLAREHVEEVISLAERQLTMKTTAPRGKIKSNILLIGPYGCGKTEFGRAIAGDPRVIGLYVSVSDILTAYMHESVKNVKRVWDSAKELRQGSRYTKSVAIIQDEFNGWFEQGEGYRVADEKQIQMELQQVLDGMIEYDGIFTVGMTNEPLRIPDAIFRRFKHVAVVGQLSRDERAELFKRFLNRGMPISSSVVEDDYVKWAEMLDNAPGDVLGKAADEVHFKYMHEYIGKNKRSAAGLERYLKKVEDRGDIGPKHRAYVKETLAGYRDVERAEIQEAVEYMLRQPPVQKMIMAAKQCYADAEEKMRVLGETSEETRNAFSLPRKNKLWDK